MNKRNVERNRYLLLAEKPVKWISKYGSITVNLWGKDWPHSGINEAGLVVQCLGSQDEGASDNESQGESRVCAGEGDGKTAIGSHQGRSRSAASAQADCGRDHCRGTKSGETTSKGNGRIGRAAQPIPSAPSLPTTLPPWSRTFFRFFRAHRAVPGVDLRLPNALAINRPSCEAGFPIVI